MRRTAQPSRFGLNDPDLLEADPEGTLGRDYPLGWDTATGTAAPPVGFRSLGTQRSAATGDVEADYTTFGPNNPDWLEADPEGTPGRDYPQGWDTATWAAAPPVGFQSLGTQRSAPAGNVGANYTTTGFDGPPETWSCGASDHDGSANAASHVEIHTAGAHVPAGMHETYDIEEVPGADYDPRRRLLPEVWPRRRTCNSCATSSAGAPGAESAAHSRPVSP